MSYSAGVVAATGLRQRFRAILNRHSNRDIHPDTYSHSDTYSPADTRNTDRYPDGRAILCGLLQHCATCCGISSVYSRTLSYT